MRRTRASLTLRIEALWEHQIDDLQRVLRSLAHYSDRIFIELSEGVHGLLSVRCKDALEMLRRCRSYIRLRQAGSAAMLWRMRCSISCAATSASGADWAGRAIEERDLEMLVYLLLLCAKGLERVIAGQQEQRQCSICTGSTIARRLESLYCPEELEEFSQ